MRTIPSAKASRAARGAKIDLRRNQSMAPCARKIFAKARAAPNSPSWKERIAAARNFPCLACTWCRMPCSRSPPAASLALSLEECAAGLASTPLTKARLQLREIRGDAVPRRQLQRQSGIDESGACARWWNWTRMGSASRCSGKWASWARNRSAVTRKWAKRRPTCASIT